MEEMTQAAIETADAEERASAVGLLQEALSPPSRRAPSAESDFKSTESQFVF